MSKPDRNLNFKWKFKNRKEEIEKIEVGFIFGYVHFTVWKFSDILAGKDFGS